MEEADPKKGKIPESVQPEGVHLDLDSGLPLPNPYPEYLPCPLCGEPEVEVWCYQKRVMCHNCGGWFDHTPAENCD